MQIKAIILYKKTVFDAKRVPGSVKEMLAIMQQNFTKFSRKFSSLQEEHFANFQ
jgi:hypothetical protein